MSNVVGNEKVFDYFGKLFPEIRNVVIDEMQPADRCRFTRCSTLSQKEAKSSKNYIYGLSVSVEHFSPIARVRICVKFDKHGNGYTLNFCIDRQTGKKVKNCVNRRYRELWSTEFDSSTDLIQLGEKEFETLLQLYQNNIQWLSLKSSRKFPENYDFGIKSLKNLTSFEMGCDWDISQIFSKLRKPLKELFWHGRKTTQSIFDFEEVYQVQNHIALIGSEPNYEQLTKLSATRITMSTASLTEMDIFNLIRSWQNSTDWEKTNNYDLCMLSSHFNFPRLLNLLEITGFDEQNHETVQNFSIKHFKDDQKTSELQYNFFVIKFILKK